MGLSSSSGLVLQSQSPAPFVKELGDSGQFYMNRVLKDWKDKCQTHVAWSRAWIETLRNLQAFVKEHHTTGLVWNNAGSVIYTKIMPMGKASCDPQL